MYIDFFELKERPYSMSPDPRFIYLTDQHSEALAKCEYTIQQRMGLSVIHGDVGAGKTTLARRLWEKYGQDKEYNFAMLVDPNYPTPFQFINEVRRELDLTKGKRSFGDALTDFQDYLFEQHKKGKTTILVVDEAQTLRPRNYELLRKLLNFETNTEKLLQIVLFGQNELLQRLDRVQALKDRVSLFGALSGLTRRDTDDLLRFRWVLAGGNDIPFTENALDAIYRLTKGSPRKVCKLCDNALVTAFTQQQKTIDRDIVESVAEEIGIVGNRLAAVVVEEISAAENSDMEAQEDAPDQSGAEQGSESGEADNENREIPDEERKDQTQQAGEYQPLESQHHG